MKRSWILFIVFCIPTVLFSQFRIGGYARNVLSYSDGPNYDADVRNTSFVKLDLSYRDHSWRVVGDLRFGLIYANNQNLAPFSIYQTQNSNLNLFFDIRRLYTRFSTEKAGTFTLGRTYVNFGMPEVFNSLEWFKSFDLTDPTEARPAINLFSWDIGIGSYSKFKAFIGSEDTWDAPIGGAEFIVGMPNLEMGFAYQRKGNDKNVLGVHFKWDTFVTFFGTYASHLDDVLTGRGFKHFYDLSIGFDYSIPINTMSLLLKQTFYYNSSGAVTLDEIPMLMARERDFYFSAYGYSYSTITLTTSEFFNIGTDILVSFLDGSGLAIPRMSFVIVNNVTLDFNLTFAYGSEESEFGPKDGISPLANLQTRLQVSF